MRNKNACVPKPDSVVSNPGSDIHVIYQGKVLPNGQIRLEEVGKESISQMINSFKDSTDITYIAQRLAMGDTSVLRDGAVYGDFTKTPKSLAESLQIIIDGEKKFNELPLDVRSSFDNSYYQFIMSAGSDSWIEKLGINKTNDAAVAVPAQEVKDES